MSKNYTSLGFCLGATSQIKNSFDTNKNKTSKNNWFASLLLIVSLFFAGFSSSAQNVQVVGADATTNAASPFATLSAAFASINLGVQSGAITITIVGDTSEPVGGAILNAGAWTTMSIVPTGTRVVSGAATAGLPLIDFNGADNVIIDGSNTLTISNTTVSPTAQTSTIRFINDATTNTIQNCTISGSGTGASTGNIIFGTAHITLLAGNDNNIITNNTIRPAGTNSPTNGIFSLGTATAAANFNSGITVSNNNIFDFFINIASTVATGILVTGGSTDWTITGNSLYQTATKTFSAATTGFIGISIANTTGINFTVSNNFIGGSAASAGGTAWTQLGATSHTFIGIRMSVGTTTASNLQGNTIKNIVITTTSASTIHSGISAVTGSMNIGTTTGNTIGSGTGTGSISFTTTGASSFTGILAGTGTPGTIAISNNIIGSITLGTGNTSLYGIRIQGAATGSLSITGNTIGSTVTPNSITSASNVAFIGIGCSNTLFPISCTGNTIANLQHTGTTTGSTLKGIEVSGSVSNQVISGNTIRNLTSASISTNATTTPAVVGILLTGSATSGNSIVNNTIRDLSNTTLTAAVNVNGIVITSTPSTTISRNTIFNLSVASSSVTSSVNGIHLFNSSATENISNNMIRLGTGISASLNPIIRGIWGNTAAGSPTNIYYNTIYIGGTQGANTVNSACIKRDLADVMDIRNNILWNDRASTGAPGAIAGRHYAIQATSILGTLTSNNNVLYTPNNGGTVGLFTTDQVTLLDWQTASTKDAASISSDPLLVDATNATTPNLHLGAGSPAIDIAVNVVGITLDLDGKSRPGANLLYDIGADERDGIAPVPNDIQATALISPTNGGSVIQSATFSPQASFTNIGTSNQTNVTVRYRIVDALAVEVYNNTFVIPSFNAGASTTVTFASTSLSSSGAFTIFAKAELVGDTVSANDQISGSLNVPIPLPGGTYTVGTGGNYTSLTNAGGAFEALNNSGVGGNITFNITSDLTGELGTNAINSFPGGYTILIKPTDAVRSITGLNSGGLIRINGADNVTIDGSLGNTANTICPLSTASRDLTITNTSTGTTSAVVWLQSNGADGATGNTVKNCNLVGNSNTTTLFGVGSGSSTIGLTSSGIGNSSNSFVNNNISKTQVGIYSQGASAANKNTGTVINQNAINTVTPNNVQRGGIYVGYDNNATISGNTIDGMVSSSDTFGISTGLTSWTATTTTGNEVSNATISKNTIGLVQNTGTNSAAGILVGQSTTGTNEVSNNMIYGVIGNSTPTDLTAGIFTICGLGATKVYYNTVSMTGDRGTGTTASSLALAVMGTDPTIDIRNNILINSQTTASTGKSYAIGLGYATFVNLTSNNNDLYTSGANGNFGVTGTLNAGTDRTTLALWQTATGQDGASQNILPVFVSATDLHIVAADPANLSLNNGAVTVSVTDDIDCDSRATDIGADEFPVVACTDAVGGTATGDATFCGSATNPTITAAGYSSGIGSGYQWESSSDGFATYPLNSSPVASQTNPAALTTGLISTTTSYRLKVTCTSGIATAFSTIVTITISTVPEATIGIGGGTFCTSSEISATGGANGIIYFQGTTSGGTSIVLGGSPQTVSTSGTYYFRSFDGSCWGAEGSVTVIIHTPAGITVTPASICQNDSGTIAAATTNCSGFVNSGTTISGAWTISSPSVDRPNTSTNSATCGFATTTPRNYEAISFQVSVAGSYTFEMDNNANYDGMGYLVTDAFTPGSCATGTFIKGDDDSGSGDEPIFTATLSTGVTYTLIATNFVTAVLEDTFNWTITPPAAGQIMLFNTGTIEWYTAASGGTAIGTGSPFNPVGVDPALPNTATPGTTVYYAACSLSNTCRTPVNFEIKATTSNTTTETACDTFTWAGPLGNGQTYTSSQSGVTHESLNAAGCTHTETLILTINTSTTGTTSANVCNTYTWAGPLGNGQTYTSNQTGITHLSTNAAGCTHTQTLNLIIRLSTTGTTNATTCNSFTWSGPKGNGQTYTTSQSGLIHVSTNAAGCSNTQTLNLTINSSSTGTTNATACNSYTWSGPLGNGQTYTSSTTVTHSSLNVFGCTHIQTLVLTINTNTTGTTNETACNTYTWDAPLGNGQTYTTSQSGITHVSTNALGCSNTQTLNLIINNTTTGTTNANACDMFTWSGPLGNGQTYTSSTTVTNESLNAAGCSHTETLILTINNSTTGTTNATACDTYTWAAPLGNGQTYASSQSGVTHVSTNALGCSHTETLNLTINNSTANSTIASACDTYTWAGPLGNGQTYTSSTTVTNESINAAGCTHTETLILTINNSTTGTTNATACTTYTWSGPLGNGQTYTSSTTVSNVTTNALGCSHTETLILTINNSTTNGSVTATASGSYTWAGPLGSGLTYSTSGVYTNTTTNAAGCTNVATLNLTITVNTFTVGTSCGSTLTNLSVTISTPIVTTAISYTFRVTNMVTNAIQTIVRPVNSFALTNLPGITYGTLYQIEVSTNGGVSFGPPCLVYTPTPVSVIESCGVTLTSMAQYVNCTFATGATGYRFRITNTATSAIQIFDSLLNKFSFNQLTSRTFATVYFVEVALRNTDGSYFPYSAGCTITTAPFPLTRIRPIQCSVTAISYTENFQAVIVAGASDYRFNLYNTTLGYTSVLERPLNAYNLSLFAGLLPGTTYNIRVAVKIDGVWGPYGVVCNVTTPAASKVAPTVSNEFKAIAFPNPFAEDFMINVKTTLESSIQIRVYDMLGKQIENKNVAISDIESLQIGSNYPSGVYNVIVSQGENTQSLRVIKR